MVPFDWRCDEIDASSSTAAGDDQVDLVSAPDEDGDSPVGHLEPARPAAELLPEAIAYANAATAWKPTRHPVESAAAAAPIQTAPERRPPRLRDHFFDRGTRLAATSFIAMVMVEVLLEAAARHLRGSPSRISSPASALVLTCGEFGGCVVISILSGGTLQVLPSSSSASVDGRPARKYSIKEVLRAWLPYVSLSCLLFVGTACANMAVTWVQFPVKVVIKSSKLIPAMAVSAVVGNSRSYSLVEYLAAAIVCVGAACFSYRAGHSDAPACMVMLGVFMLLIAIVCDVVAVNAQQWMMQKVKIPPMTMMLRQNFVCFVAAVLVLAFSGEMHFVIAEALVDPTLLLYTIAIGSAMALAVWANAHLINEAGCVAQVGISTFRKIFTVLFSYVLFPKPLSTIHAVAMALVGSGLLLQAHGRRRESTPQGSACAPELKVVACKEPLATADDLEAQLRLRTALVPQPPPAG